MSAARCGCAFASTNGWLQTFVVSDCSRKREKLPPVVPHCVETAWLAS
jgi:hypothetical protein